jgi:hypothetical protein
VTTLSNNYVEKVISEHPIAVWMLNEDVDYLSSISETEREFYNASEWSVTGATLAQEINVPETTPFPDSALTNITGAVPAGPTGQILLTSIYDVPTTTFSTDLANFAMSFYLYIDSPYITSVEFGYEYYDPITLTTEQITYTKNITTSDFSTWVFLSNTFSLLPAGASNPKFIIIINTETGGGVGDYGLLINGLTVGQWSEEFYRTSLGVTPLPLPSDIALPYDVTYGLPECIVARPYGASTLNAYYLAHDNRLYANNFGIPLVYGSSNVTKLFPHVHDGTPYPNLIFPGYGFLNDRGRFNEYTVEMWVRINTDAQNPQKFFGPINSNDGLYVEGAYMTLVIGNQFASHYVGEWFRPMLVHIRYIQNNITVLVNGEQVINIDIIQSQLDFPNEFDLSGKSNDWLGFYCYEDVKPIDIDSFAIYSYAVPTEVAKRRWVWGQGVVAPETTNSLLNATTAFNDYSFTNYASNYNYPDFASWRQAFFSNVETSSNFLQLPEYSLPQIFLDDFEESAWYADMKTAESAESYKYYTFRPDVAWASKNCYLYFSNFGVLNDIVTSVYGVFESDGTAVNEPLFKITNKITEDFILVKINGTSLTYNANIAGLNNVVRTETITADQKFTAGINIQAFSLLPIPGINKFFADESVLNIYITGDSVTTFTGKTYRFGFEADYNNRKISTLYDSQGIFNSNLTTANTMMSHVANYTLKAFDKYGTFFLDIAVAGYWEDYMPLSYFSKKVVDYSGNEFYDLDTIQINLDYPEPLEVSALESVSSWTYADLNIRYSDPVQLDYSILDNSFYSGWDDYEDMSEDSDKYYYYNTTNNGVKSYVSFQRIVDGANKNLVDFEYKTTARVLGVVDPENIVEVDGSGDPLPIEWENTAYEVVDGTVVYPPRTDQNNNAVDFNDLAIVYHLEFQNEGITHHPMIFRDLQLASQVLERSKFTPMGTRFGVPVFPYTRNGVYYNYKAANPISTYKGSTPYLYLNRHSGWRIRGRFSPFADRGVSIAINQQVGLDVEVSAIQMWIRFSEIEFPTEETPIFSIDHKNGIYDFYIEGDESTQRGYILARDRETQAIVENIKYYINGKLVDLPYIINEQWTVLGVAFQELLDFDSYTGRLNLNGPLTYNNVSYYLATNLEQNQRVEVRSWGQVKDDSITGKLVNDTPSTTTIYGWEVWKYDTSIDPPNYLIWQNIAIASTSDVYSIDPSTIYSKYTGTDRIIIDDEIDGVLVDPEQLSIYSDISWSTRTTTPV